MNVALLQQIVDEVVKEEMFKTSELQGPYTVHVKKGRLAGQTVMANKHKVTGVYYYLNPDTGTDEPIGTENDLNVQKQQDEGVGYVYAKDREKDPKSIPGEHWRIKFQSSSDLKKHGHTEKSKVDEASVSKKDIKGVIKELVDEMWADIGTVVSGGDETLPDDEKTLKPTGRVTEPGADENLVNLYRNGGGKTSIEALPSVGGAMSERRNEGKTMKKETLINLIHEVIQEVRYEDPAYREQQELLAMRRIQSYAHWGKIHALKHPNEVVGLFEKIAQEVDGLVQAHEKGKEVSPSNVHERVVNDVAGYQNPKIINLMKKIQSYAQWGVTNARDNKPKSKAKIDSAFKGLILDINNLMQAHARGMFSLDKNGLRSLKVMEAYAHWGNNNPQKQPNEIVAIFQRIFKEINKLIQAYKPSVSL
jgi:hypothetical protein